MANYNTYYQRDYSKGLNDSVSDREAGRDEASYLRNWDIRYRGQLRSRKGLTQYGDTLSGTTIHSSGVFARTSGSNDFLIGESTNIRYYNAGSWSSIDSGFTAESMWIENCPVKNKVYISSRNNQQHSWDRSSTTLNSALTDLGASVPHGNVLKWWKNHMFTINDVVVSGTVYGNRVHISNFGDPDTWTGSDYINLPGVGGRGITFGELGDSLVILKERAIMFLTGYGTASWTLSSTVNNVENVDEAVGTLSPRGGCRVGNEWWFIDDQGFIRRLYQTDFDAFRRDIISTKIPTLLGSLNMAQLSQAVMATFDDKVFCAIPTDASTTNDLVLVYDLRASARTGEEAWTVYEGTGWTPSTMLTFSESGQIGFYLTDATSGKVYKHEGNDDLDTAISCRWDGRADDYNYPDRWKKYTFGRITAPNQGDKDVTIHASVDGGSFATLDTFNLAGTGSTLGPTGSFNLGPTGDATLGGSETLEEKYYFGDGGGTITGKTAKMSIRCSETTPVIVNTFTNNYRLRELK